MSSTNTSKQWAITDLAIDAPVAIGTHAAHRRIFQKRATRTTSQATRMRRTAQMAVYWRAQHAAVGIFEAHPITEDVLIARQCAQVHPRSEVVRRRSHWPIHMTCLTQALARIPFHLQLCRPIAATPQRRAAVQHIAACTPPVITGRPDGAARLRVDQQVVTGNGRPAPETCNTRRREESEAVMDGSFGWREDRADLAPLSYRRMPAVQARHRHVYRITQWRASVMAPPLHEPPHRQRQANRKADQLYASTVR
ncbi:hypothetical protein LMG31886_42640 [Xanthomonas hydrangeae]|nr:hypothetical protein LMG31884_43720 [Xanthomonas hydrangeae]CAD7729595.1 hypothetical protein LMG31884_43720 [Xanthomonas hydrangeae]CAD7732324.1 hypothetical protein LMG31885_17750 [Xanthomonas hydrangeae]CAD7732327.1 hypothetical protein LMG31885_17750 [Xanthomonas hydrangeae]CAD7744952.1 hypothetical protein LMG31887_43640 [Xanthomonas hydrangeae]